MKLFLQKNAKNFERWGLRPQTPVPPAAGGFAPKLPASGSWGLRPQTPQTAPPIANFWLRAWMHKSKMQIYFILSVLKTINIRKLKLKTIKKLQKLYLFYLFTFPCRSFMRELVKPSHSASA